MANRKAPPVRHDAPGMKGPRSRNEDGELRQKRGDTHVGTIEQQYGVNFGVRSDMKLDTLRERLGATSIDDLIDKTGS
jgi:hypothetical protein